MKKILLSLFALFVAYSSFAQNNPGDTITVQTFTFGSPQDAWFIFPSDTMRYEKIMMKYTLKCNPAQNPACGEWDYLTNTYAYDHTGLLDSSRVVQSMFMVNGGSPDSIAYSNTPTYAYDSTWQYFIVHTNTSSVVNSQVGNGTASSSAPFGASQPVSRSQFLWKASEMTTAGMTAGNITGLQFYVQSLGGSLRNLTIRMQHTTLDSLTQATFTNTGFTDVYSLNTFLATGWNSLQLTNAFNWNGTSNLLIEITYDNYAASTDNILAADTTALFKSALTNSTSDRVVSANVGGHIDIPVSTAFTAIDSFVTVAYWSYGDVALQPQSGTCFEATDSLGQRVLNVHGPWGDNNVYWDAGNSGGSSYDRINKLATTPETEGQWNYWVFTKNVATGSMKVYLNGVLWHSGTGKTRSMENIRNFRIEQGRWSGSESYAGRMNDFMVFDKELSLTEIQGYMNQSITPSDPNYAHLAVYYRFDDGNNATVADSANGNHPSAVLSDVQNPLLNSTELTAGFTESKLRPNVIFEQGIYTSHLDSLVVIDSTLNTAIQVVLYQDSVNNPGIATDTLTVWPVAANGNPDSIIYQSTYDYYHIFPEVIRYELARYITPYGNGLSLGNGWTWTFDVSDYVTLLHDSVHLSAGNWQELLDVKFLMIVGTPPRDVIGIENLYNGNFDYGDAVNPIDNNLPPLTVNIPANAVNSRYKSRITGHGMDSPGNCAEFCPKNHYFYVNNNLQYTKLVWRDNCDLNPLYPQGGTWVYDRANWCPGAEVWTYDMELTPYVTPGNAAVLNHDVQAYVHTSGWDYYQIEDQIVYYGAPNFTLDARLDEILSPGTNQMWGRFNTVCTNPKIKITNTGSTTLTSLTISYGMVGGVPSVYNWTGSLAFLESTEITLGTFGWVTGATEFSVSLSNPNGGTDQYPYNDTRVNPFTYPQVMPSIIVVEMRSNLRPWENNYTLKNSAGTVLLSRTNLVANTIYRDTLTLPTDCYEFELTDSGEDGLSWWASSQGNGYVRIKNALTGVIVRSYNSDFGGQVYQQFTVGLTNPVDETMMPSQPVLNVYPNPSNGLVYFDVNLSQASEGEIAVYDLLGNKVYSKLFSGTSMQNAEADFSGLAKGVYFVTLNTGNQTVTQKLLLN